MTDRQPLVSVIVPCRNEGRWIAACLQSILANDYPADCLEILVVDGMSNDDTRAGGRIDGGKPSAAPPGNQRKEDYARGLESGHCGGRRQYRHSHGCPRRVSRAITSPRWCGSCRRSGADNVGGVCQTLPAGDSAMAKAIAVGMSHPLGVGNSHFRIGSAEDRWVDTVPFGCYRREVFDRIGLFDEELVRNQDDELNLRLIKHGGRILLSPRIVCKYIARDSLAKLWRMYYQYGYFKPLVVRKVGGVMTLRQLAPPLLVLGLAVTALAGLLGLAALPLSLESCCPPALRAVCRQLPIGHRGLCRGGCTPVWPGRGRGAVRGLPRLALELRDRLLAGSGGVPRPPPQPPRRCRGRSPDALRTTP